MRDHEILTPGEVYAWIDYHGLSLAEFCRVHALNRNMVSDLLRGRKKGARGEAHRAAVLLRLKAGHVPADAPRLRPHKV